MKSWFERANEEIVKALSAGDDVVFGKTGEFYVVTIRPFYVAHILRDKQVFFALDKAKQNEKLAKMFCRLLNLENTVKDENRIKATGAYWSDNGRDFLKEYGGEKISVWLNAKFVKDLEPFAAFYQESAETAEANRDTLPVLAVSNGRPARIILPARKYN